MVERLITFETAKLAKEKGFKEFTISGYNSEELDEFKNMFKTKHQLGICSNEGKSNLYAAPTQSFLQKWLREVHNVYIGSYHDLTSDGKNIQYYTNYGFLSQKDKNGNLNVNGGYDEYNDWRTYEEALEFGLQEALKLIK